jgi:hypothetical protein
VIPDPFPGQSLAEVFGHRAGAVGGLSKVYDRLLADGMDPQTPVELCGWRDSPDRHALAATFAPPFAQVARGLMGDSADVLLYKAWKEALGSYPSYVRQEIGDCTSFGSGHALDLLQCVEIVLGKQPIAFLETCTEAIYGMGREIANMLGGGDGCYGVAVAKALTDGGAVPRKLVGSYSGRRAKEWGSRGVPAEIKKAAAEHRLGAAAMVTTLDELDAALANLYPAAGGFGQGFTMHRDQDGVCRQSGRWGHEQCCAARRTKNGRRQYLLCQSWGPGVPDGPTTDDQPDFSFWVDETSMADILGQRDFLAFSKFGGFESRPLPPAWTYSDYI